MSRASTTQAAISMPSMKRCGSRSKIVPVLEGAGLALVSIHRHQTRRRLGPNQRPFASSGKTGAAEPAQPGIAHDLDQIVARTLPRLALP